MAEGVFFMPATLTLFIDYEAKYGDARRKWISVHSDYDPLLVASLKSMVPPRYRQWDPAKRRWIVAEDYRDELLESLRLSGMDFVWVGEASKSRSGGNGQGALIPVADDYKVLQVSKGACYEVVKAAYKALATIYHTDNLKTGNKAKMQEINAAWERLSKTCKRAS